MSADGDGSIAALNLKVPSADVVLSRAEAVRKLGAYEASSLMHAYVACLSRDETAKAAIDTLVGDGVLHRAIVNRIDRLARGGTDSGLSDLAFGLLQCAKQRGALARRADAALSRLYTHFDPPVRQTILEIWKDRGTVSGRRRWLKAVVGDELLLNLSEVEEYWRRTYEDGCAIVLVARLPEESLRRMLPKLVETCGEGWIASKALLRLGEASDETWATIRTRFPPTYAYLCAKTGRALTDEEAADIINESADDLQAGLAIWAAGQLKKWSVLEQVRTQLEEKWARGE